MSTLHTQRQKNQSIIWLVCGVLCLFCAGIFWLITDEKTVHAPKQGEDAETEIPIEPEKVAASVHLGSLIDEVKPLENTARIKIAGVHEAEFRGTKFLTENKNKHTIELFRSSKEDVIKNFLRKQEARHQFTYIRLSGEGVQEQFVLLYGNFNNSSAAEDALSQAHIGLPRSIKPSVHSFSDYVNQVNDLGSEEVGVSNVLHAIKLSPAIIPKIEVITPQATTSMTVTRKDQDGNVLDVQKTQDNVQTAPVSDNNPISTDVKVK